METTEDEKILHFVTGITWEPLYGFTMEPTIHFQAKKFEVPLVPHCCQYLCKHNIVPAMTFVLNDEDQYKMYDMAFMNIYFGLGNY